MAQINKSSFNKTKKNLRKNTGDFLEREVNKSVVNRILKIFWWVAGVGLILTVLIFALIANGFVGYMPPIEELENPKNKLATEVLSADGVPLSTYYYGASGNRVPVTYDQISPYLVKALIATEDVRFKNHSGIDVKALFRAVFKRVLLFDRNAGGGSTLSQQLAKQLYTPQAENVFQRALQKPIEWVIAVQLERFYTKEEILTMYLNQYDFLYNAVGIKTASYVYFGVTPDKLDLVQSATLVGMCKNSNYYNPQKHPERARERRNTVLNQMRKADYLTRTQCDSAQALPLTLSFHRVDHKEGLAPYFREYLRQMLIKNKPRRSNYADWQKQNYRDDSLAWETNPLYGWCNKNQKEDGSSYNLYTDGLKIYTTIDSRMQQYAEEAVAEHISYLQGLFFKEKAGRSYGPYTKNLQPDQIDKIMKRSVTQSERYRVMKAAGFSETEIDHAFHTKVEMTVYSIHGMRDTMMTPLDSIRYHKFFLRAGFMAMDPFNGAVRAYVGGVSFTPFQYDMIMSGRRQVGSTIKPYLYTMAMEEGFSPCDKVKNVPITITDEIGRPWSPRNASSARVGEIVTLRWGLANSNNWISAYVMSHFSPYAFVRMLRSFGLNGQVDPVVSLCVGTCDASVGEMVSAYTSFANRGIKTQPLFVTRIEDKNGNILAHFSPQMAEVFSEETSYKMLSMIRAVVDQGTANRIRWKFGITAPMGGKTGTTQNNSDGWFMGVTPHLVGGVWVGGEERDIHFDFTNEGQGASMALPIWAYFMKKVYADPKCGVSQTDAFMVPPGMEFNCVGNEPSESSDNTTEGTSNSVFDDL
jgi:penicillin-binding protein 1A